MKNVCTGNGASDMEGAGEPDFRGSSRAGNGAPLAFLALILLLAVEGAWGATTLVGRNAVWRYRDDGSDQGVAWRAPVFDDSSWTSGPAKLGFGGDGETTVLTSGRRTYYFRRAFTVGYPAYTNLTVRLLRDDGGVVYFNGVEVFRSNMPTGTISAATLALSNVGPPNETNYFSTNLSAGFVVGGTNVLAVELHQFSTNSEDAGFALELLAFGDEDSDGMPDSWEVAYGLNPNNASDAQTDTDGDGITNLSEYRADTSPTNPASSLRLTFQLQQTSGVLTYSTSPNVFSYLQSAPTLASYWVNMPGGSGISPYIFPINGAQAFFRAAVDRNDGGPLAYSQNIVGFRNTFLRPGSNWLINPFLSASDNINDLIPSAPEGTCAFKFNGQFWEVACYDFGFWDPFDFEVPRGQPLVVNAPQSFTVTFGGDGSVGPPVIFVPPPSQEVAEGLSAVFDLQVLGAMPFSYQWFFNGVPLPGATNLPLIVTDARSINAGNYHVVVSNSSGSVTSSVATLTVLLPASIVDQPDSTVVASGGSFTLCVTPDGSPPFTYNWRRNGVNIPWATNSCLTVTNVQLVDGGTYSVVVANEMNSVLSESAQVVVAVPQTSPGDMFSAPVVILGTNGTIGGTNTLATREVNEPLHAGKPGERSVWFSWTAPASGVATFRTLGSTFDTLLAIYTGANVGSLVRRAADEDRGGSLTSVAQFNAVQNTTYRIAVDGFAGSRGNFALTWSLEVGAQLPVIITQPVGGTVLFADSFTFTVVASGSGLTYQWFRGTNVVPGATAPTLAITNVISSDVGDYVVRVGNSSGRFVVSQKAALEIGQAVGIRSRDKLLDLLLNTGEGASGGPGFAPASVAGGFASVAMGSSVSHVLDNQGAQTEPGEPPPCGTIGGASKWFGLRPEANGLMVIDTIGTPFDTTLSVYTGPTNLPPGTDPAFLWFFIRPVTCDANGGPDELTSVAAFYAQAGSNYMVAVDGVGSSQGQVRLNWRLLEPPVMPSSPARQLAKLGSPFIMERFPTPPPANTTIRWLHDGTNVPGGTNASLIVAHSQLRHGGRYTAITRQGNNAPVTTAIANVVTAGFVLSANPTAFSVNARASSAPILLEHADALPGWSPVVLIDKNEDARAGFGASRSLPAGSDGYYRLRLP